MRALKLTALAVLCTLGALLAAAAAVVAAAIWVLDREGGAEWLVAQAEQRSGGAFAAQQVEGTLRGGLTLRGVRVRLPGDEVDVERVRLTWDASALLTGRIVLDAVRAGPIVYRRLERDAAADDEGFSFTLPLPIVVRDAVLEQVTLEAGGEPIVLGETRLAGRASGSSLRIDRIDTSSSGFEASGRGEVELATPLRLTAEIAWSGDIAGDSYAGGGALEGTLPALALRHRLTLPYDVLAEGELLLEPVPRVDLRLSWAELALPAPEPLTLRAGSVDVMGNLEDFRLEGGGELEIEGEALRFAATVAGGGSALRIEAFTLESVHGTLRAEGTADLEALAWDLLVTASDVNPAARYPDWPGSLGGRGRLRGSWRPELAWSVEELDLAGVLRGLPLAASGGVAHAADRWRLSGVRVESGANVIALDGTIADALDLVVAADVRDTATLLPDLEGALNVEAAITGTLAEPRAQGRLTATHVRYGDYAADRVVVASAVRAGERPALDLDIDATGVVRGNLNAAAVQARFRGALQDHEVTVDAQAEQWAARLAARGALAGSAWTGSLETLTVDQQALGQWRLSNRAALALAPDGVRLASTCLLQAEARLCAALQLTGRPDDRLEITAERFDVQAFAPFLPPDIGAQGIYGASVLLTDLGSSPRGSVSVTGGTTVLRLGLPGQMPLETSIENVALEAAIADRRLVLEASFEGRDTGSISLSARVDDVQNRHSPVAGELRAFWSDLAFLALLTPDVGEVGGELGIDLMIGGTRSAPTVEGRAQLDDGRVGVPPLGLVVEGIEARATSADGRSLEFTATGLIGESQVRLAGATVLDPDAGWPTRVTLVGDSVPAVRLPEAEIFVSPDLEAEIRGTDIRVSGTVHVPRARVTIQELPTQAVAPSADTVVHGVDLQPEAVRPLLMRADLRLTLGEDVRYTGLNLTTAVTGEMRLAYTSGRPASASGSVNLDGEYNAYNQTLGLERGELIFAGPLDDPALDVRAVREIGDVTVGVQLSGTLKAPETRVFSSPAMSETDALSYLVFGRPLISTGGEDSDLLQSAAIAMGLQQALPVVQRIGESLGLDEFTVQSTDREAGALMAGKYLSPNVYIRYSYGLFNRVGGLLLRFRVNERLSLETQSGDHKSMDLLYTVEKP